MKSFTTLLLILVGVTSAFAQDVGTTTTSSSTAVPGMFSSIVLKPSVGINITDLSKDPVTGNSKGRIGWQVGAALCIGNKIYVEPGVYYLQKSSKIVSTSTSVDDVKLDISGIRVPLAIGAHVVGDKSSLLKLRVFGGGSAFFVTDVKDADKDDFENPTWGLFAGAGIDYSLAFIEAQYEWSLTNVQKDLSVIDVGKSRTIFINVGVKFPL